jgi:hypothetical protein
MRSQLPGLNLDLAWKRSNLDHLDRCFVSHPHFERWVEQDQSRWLGALRTDLQAGYSPREAPNCFVLKPKWLLRQAAILERRDEVVYNALVGHLYHDIYDSLGVWQGDPDLAYLLRSDPDEVRWVRSGVSVWRQWREKSLARLNAGALWVVIADISGFYDNIALGILRSDLNSITGQRQCLDLLLKCLNRWAGASARGVPQGYSASDILAKVYLSPVDRALRLAGFDHLRYVDDVRIFCRSRLEAKRAILTLTAVLRQRGLSLQSAKTEILTADQARASIDGVSTVIAGLQRQLAKELREVDSSIGPYATVAELERFVEANPEAPAPSVLEKAFRERFATSSAVPFDKTLLHYLLTRLGKARSRAGVRYCLSLLRNRPEETQHSLRYLAQVQVTPAERCKILEYAGSDEAIYDHQLYLIVRWFFERQAWDPQLLSLCRRWAFDRNRASFLRSYALAVLGAAADPADLERIQTSYSECTSDTERADVAAALVGMELSRRNGFYGAIESDGDLVQRAVRLARLSTRPARIVLEST